MDLSTNPKVRAIRIGVPALGAAETLFWAYTVHFVFSRANPTGDGMEILALFPMTLILLLGSLPGLVLGLFRSTVSAGLLFVVASLLANVVVWPQLLGELGPWAG